MLLPRILPSCWRSACQRSLSQQCSFYPQGHVLCEFESMETHAPPNTSGQESHIKCRAHSSALNLRGLMVSFDGPSSFADTDWTNFLFFLSMSIMSCSPLCLSTEVGDKNKRRLKAHQSFTCHFRKWTQGRWYINPIDFPLHFDSLLPTLKEIYSRILRKCILRQI